MYLPQHIWIKIYEYDNTYHEIFKKVLSTLICENKFWRIKQSNPPLNMAEMTIFEMSYSDALSLCNYWNTFSNKHDINLSGFLPNNSFYYPENISDISGVYPLIDKQKNSKVYSLLNI